MSVTVVVTIVYTVGKPPKVLPDIPYQPRSLDKQYIAIIGMNFTTLIPYICGSATELQIGCQGLKS